jgi:hypothetical protein
MAMEVERVALVRFGSRDGRRTTTGREGQRNNLETNETFPKPDSILMIRIFRDFDISSNSSNVAAASRRINRRGDVFMSKRIGFGVGAVGYVTTAAVVLTASLAMAPWLSAHATYTSSGGHFVESVTDNGPCASPCVLKFTQVPNGKRLIITSMSCVVKAWTSVKGIHAVKLGDSNTPPYLNVTAPYTPIGASFLYEDAPYQYFSATAQVYHVITYPAVPLIGIEFSNYYLRNSICTIGGKLQDLP